MGKDKPSYLITESLEARGRFWVPNTPEKSVAGILSFAPSGRISLRTEPYPIAARDCLPDIDASDFTLHGSIESRDVCSLLNAAVVRESSSWTEGGMALETRELRARSAVIGDLVDSEDAQVFASVSVRFPYLHEWTGAVTVGVEHPTDERVPRNVTLPYTRRTLLSSVLPAIGRLHLVRGLGLKQEKNGQLEVSYDTRFEIEADDLLSVTSIIKIARQLQDLLTLLFGVSVTPDLILAHRGTGRPEKPKARILYVPVGDNQQEPQGVVPFDHCKEQLPAAITTWFSENLVMDTVRPLLLGTFHSKQAYVENKFLSLAQAIESFHRVSKGGTVVAESVYEELRSELVNGIRSSSAPAELKKRLEEHLAFGNELPFETRIREVVAEVTTEARECILGDIEYFVAALKQTRNYLTHPGIRKGTRVLERGGKMFLFNQRLQALLTLLLLGKAGLTHGLTKAIDKRIWDTQVREIAAPPSARRSGRRTQR